MEKQKKVQYKKEQGKKSTTWKEYDTAKVQHAISATWRECKEVQHGKSTTGN